MTILSIIPWLALWTMLISIVLIAIGHPLLSAVECGLSKNLSGRAKALWIIASLFCGVLASLPYTFFVSQSTKLRRFTAVVFGAAVLSILTLVTLSFVSPTTDSANFEAMTMMSQPNEDTIDLQDPIFDELLTESTDVRSTIDALSTEQDDHQPEPDVIAVYDEVEPSELPSDERDDDRFDQGTLAPAVQVNPFAF